MKYTKITEKNLKSKFFYRALSYSLTISSILFLLILLQRENFHTSYWFLASIGFVVVALESFFTVYYAKQVYRDRFEPMSDYHFFHHGINHVIYPIGFYFGLALYTYYSSDLLEAILLNVVGFILYFFNFFYVSRHLIEGHFNEKSHDVSLAKMDFTMYVFKLFSYFAMNLALFQAYSEKLFSLNVVFVINVLINFLYLASHLNRKDQVTNTNLFITVLFSLVIGFFIIQAKLPYANYSATASTIIFYLASGVFFNKLDGTLNNKIIMEYASIAVILTIFLFTN